MSNTFKIDPHTMITVKQSELIKKLAIEKDWSLAPTTVSITVKKVTRTPGSLADVRRQAASDAISFLLSECKPASQANAQAPVTGTVTVTWNSLQTALAKLPVSRYAIPSTADPEHPVFFQIVEKKDGRRFVNKLQGEPGDWHRIYLTPAQAKLVIDKVAEDPTKWASWYCEKFQRCSACDSPLSNKVSLAEAMGPICRKKFKW